MVNKEAVPGKLKASKRMTFFVVSGVVVVSLLFVNTGLDSSYKVADLRDSMSQLNQQMNDQAALQNAKLEALSTQVENLKFENTVLKLSLEVLNNYVYTYKNDRIMQVRIQKLVKSSDGPTFDLEYRWQGGSEVATTTLDYSVGVFGTDVNGLVLMPQGLDALAQSWATSSQSLGPQVVLVFDPTHTYVQQIFMESAP